jgi:hypothetical protein
MYIQLFQELYYHFLTDLSKVIEEAISQPNVEILGLFLCAHIRFHKFLEISKPMCVNPCVMQLKLLAVQRQEVEAKFSPTWKIGRDINQHIG